MARAPTCLNVDRCDKLNMKKQRRVEKDGLIVTHFGGLHTYADAKEALDELLEINPYFEKIARKKNFYSRDLMKTIASQGSIAGLEEIPKDIRRVFVTAHDISPEWHVRIQAAFQKHTDNAV